MFVPEFISSYAESHPNHFIVAAEHTFDCNCMDCITFLYTTGEHLFDLQDPAYKMIQNWEVIGEVLSSTQIYVLRQLFDKYL